MGVTLRTDLDVVPLPQPLPNFGNLYGKNIIQKDPDFGTKIVRLSDGRDWNYKSIQTSDSAYAGIWNKDDTLISPVATGEMRLLYQFNPSTMQGSLLPWRTTGHVCFSRTSAETLYTLLGTIVYKNVFKMVSNVWTFVSSTKVCDFANILPSSFKTKWSSTFTISSDDSTFAIAFSEGIQDTAYLVCVYQKGHGTSKGVDKGYRLLDTHTGLITGGWGAVGTCVLDSPIKLPFYLHEVQTTPNNLYVSLCPIAKTADTNLIWTVDTLSITDLQMGAHQALGMEHAYGGGAGGGQLTECPYILPVRPYRNIVTKLPASYHGDRHFAFGKLDIEDQSIVWASSGGSNVTVPITSTWDSEVFGYDIAKGIVYRACHTFNSDQSLQFIVLNAVACPSQSGKFVAFTSDIQGSLGSTSGSTEGTLGVDARGDVFIVKVV